MSQAAKARERRAVRSAAGGDTAFDRRPGSVVAGRCRIWPVHGGPLRWLLARARPLVFPRPPGSPGDRSTTRSRNAVLRRKDRPAHRCRLRARGSVRPAEAQAGCHARRCRCTRSQCCDRHAAVQNRGTRNGSRVPRTPTGVGHGGQCRIAGHGLGVRSGRCFGRSLDAATACRGRRPGGDGRGWRGFGGIRAAAGRAARQPALARRSAYRKIQGRTVRQEFSQCRLFEAFARPGDDRSPAQAPPPSFELAGAAARRRQAGCQADVRRRRGGSSVFRPVRKLRRRHGLGRRDHGRRGRCRAGHDPDIARRRSAVPDEAGRSEPGGLSRGPCRASEARSARRAASRSADARSHETGSRRARSPGRKASGRALRSRLANP